MREPETLSPAEPQGAPIRATELRRLGLAYWRVVLVGAVLTLARFSEAFLVLRAEAAGLAVSLLPLVMVVMSVVYAASAYPAGALSDRIDRRHLLAAGCAALIAADLVLALTSGIGPVMAGIGLWGLHMGLTQGLLAALVADTCPGDLRGTAFGLFNLISGVVLLAASLLAGFLWGRYGAPATFLAGAGCTGLALIGLLLTGARR